MLLERPTVLVPFPLTPDPSLHPLALGLVGVVASALYAFGADVLTIATPGLDLDRAKEADAVFGLVHDGPPSEPDACLLMEIEPGPACPTISVRLENADGVVACRRTLRGRPRDVVRGCARLVERLAAAVGLESFPVRWQVMFQPARTAAEAIARLEIDGAQTMLNRRRMAGEAQAPLD